MASGASAGIAPVDAAARSAGSAGELPTPAGGGSPLYLELPPPGLDADRTRQIGGQPPADRSPRPAGTPATGISGAGIPETVLAAYQRAAGRLAAERPSCGVPVALLAAIGRVESNHARGGALDRTGRARPPIVGPQLNGGPGVAAIRDTDGGRLDGDPAYDRAVGPMQFIPSTWAGWRADGNADGVADPQHIFDATLAAARYLCAAGGDLTVAGGLHRAIRAYNRPDHYLRAVLSWLRVYSGGPVPVPDSAAAAGTDRPPAPREDRRTEPASASADPEQDPGPEEPAREEPAREDPAREEPADRDDQAQPDPVQETAEELLEPVDELADGTPVDPPPLPG